MVLHTVLLNTNDSLKIGFAHGLIKYERILKYVFTHGPMKYKRLLKEGFCTQSYGTRKIHIKMGKDTVQSNTKHS